MSSMSSMSSTFSWFCISSKSNQSNVSSPVYPVQKYRVHCMYSTVHTNITPVLTRIGFCPDPRGRLSCQWSESSASEKFHPWPADLADLAALLVSTRFRLGFSLAESCAPRGRVSAAKASSAGISWSRAFPTCQEHSPPWCVLGVWAPRPPDSRTVQGARGSPRSDTRLFRSPEIRVSPASPPSPARLAEMSSLVSHRDSATPTCQMSSIGARKMPRHCQGPRR